MAFNVFSKLFGGGPSRNGGGPDQDPSAVRLIVGLGNPGAQYAQTRHNVGFMVLNRIARDRSIKFSRAKIWHAEVAKDQGAVFIKPVTFMNESGRAVERVRKYHKLNPEQVLVIYDDVALPLGKIRLRAKGSAGGHNGIKDIIRLLGTDSFPRIKIGIAPPVETRHDLSDFVLGKFSGEERSELEKVIPSAIDAVTHVLDHGIEDAMNHFN